MQRVSKVLNMSSSWPLKLLNNDLDVSPLCDTPFCKEAPTNGCTRIAKRFSKKKSKEMTSSSKAALSFNKMYRSSVYFLCCKLAKSVNPRCSDWGDGLSNKDGEAESEAIASPRSVRPSC